MAVKRLEISQEKRDPLLWELFRLLTDRNPAAATPILVEEVISSGTEDSAKLFQAKAAFAAWMKQDLEAAGAWYTEALAAGSLEAKGVGKSALHGLIRLGPGDISSLLAHARLSALLKAKPDQAASEIQAMPPADAAYAIASLAPRTYADQIASLAHGLPAEFRRTAISRLLSEKADSSPDQAIALAKQLELPPPDQVDLLVKMATKNKQPDWNTVPEQLAWLRSQAPTDHAAYAVGRTLAVLAANSEEKALQAYEAELARHGAGAKGELTGAFASHLPVLAHETAQKLISTMPEGPERDAALKSAPSLEKLQPETRDLVFLVKKARELAKTLPAGPGRDQKMQEAMNASGLNLTGPERETLIKTLNK